MTMTAEQFDKYQSGPLAADYWVRKQFNIPEDRYFTVSIYPIPGEVRINPTLVRQVKAHKISKSDTV